MNRNRSRADLAADIYATLGAPVVKVNLTPDQVDKAIDAAIKILWRWHVDFSFENFYAYQATQEDVDRQYFTIPEYFDGVSEVLPRSFTGNDMSFTNAIWQIQRETVNSTIGFQSISLVDYVAMQQRYSNMRATMGANTMPFTFVRLQHRVIPHFRYNVGEFIVLRVNETVDAERVDDAHVAATLLWDNEMLKALAVANAKQIWGNILSRFKGMTLPGGVQIDGAELLQQSKDEMDEVMKKLDDQTVVNFLMG